MRRALKLLLFLVLFSVVCSSTAYAKFRPHTPWNFSVDELDQDKLIVKLRDKLALSFIKDKRGGIVTDGTQDISMYGFALQKIRIIDGCVYVEYPNWTCSDWSKKESFYNEAINRFNNIVLNIEHSFGNLNYAYIKTYGDHEEQHVFYRSKDKNIPDIVTVFPYEKFETEIESNRFGHLSITAVIDNIEISMWFSVNDSFTSDDEMYTRAGTQVVFGDADLSQVSVEEIDAPVITPQPSALPETINLG